MYTGDNRIKVEQYLRSQNLLGRYPDGSTQADRDSAFDQAFELQRERLGRSRGASNSNSLMDLLIAIISGLLGVQPEMDWRDPSTAGLSGQGRFSSIGERHAAIGQGIRDGRVQAVEVEPGTRSAASLVVELARQELGVTETRGANRGSRIAEYGAAANAGDGIPWCCTFQSFIAARAGITVQRDGVGGTARVLDMEAQYARRGALRSLREATPQSGDTLFFSRGGPNSGQGHVGLIESVNGDTVTVIEGNSGDAVRRNTYSLQALRQGAHGARSFGSIDEITRGNPRFAARGQDRAPAQAPTSEVTPPAQTPSRPARLDASGQLSRD